MKARSMKCVLKCTIIMIISIILSTSLPGKSLAVADPNDVQFWSLYEQAENFKSEGNMNGAIYAWYSITQLYNGEYTERAYTRRAVYWAEIAKAYEGLELYQNASEAYGQAGRNWEALGYTESALWPLKYEVLYRTEMELYTKSTDMSISKGSGEPAKFEPESGAYVGGTFVRDPMIKYNMDRISTVYGRNHNLLLYLHWNKNEFLPVWATRYINQTGIPIQVALEPDSGLDEVKSNGYLYNLAKSFNELKVPIFLRFASEMNQDGYAWYGDPSKYIEKFRLVTEVMREHAPNVAMVWSPNYVPTDIANDYYPGDEWVDWVGIDSYLHYYPMYAAADSTGLQAEYSEGPAGDPLDKLKYFYDKYSSRKPIFISETGIQNFKPNSNLRVIDWSVYKLRYLYYYLPLKYPRVKAIFYYNNMFQSFDSHSNYGLSFDNRIINAYKDAVNDSYYITSPDENIGYTYQTMENFTWDGSGTVTIRPYIRVPFQLITSVKAYLNGEFISESNTLPFEFDLSSSGIYTSVENTLRVEAYAGTELKVAVNYKLYQGWDGMIHVSKTGTEIFPYD